MGRCRGGYRQVPQRDRDWLLPHLDDARSKGIPVVAIEYLPPEQRKESRELAARLVREGFIPYITSPELNALGVSSIEVQPRRIGLVYDPREGELEDNPGHIYLGGLLEYLGYRVDYWPADASLPQRSLKGLYAGVVVWMTSGAPEKRDIFEDWLNKRLDEQVPLAFFSGLPLDNDSLLSRLGIRTLSQPIADDAVLESHDAALVGGFEAPMRLRTRELPALTVTNPDVTQAAVALRSGERRYVPVATGSWGGYVLTPYVFEEGWITVAGSSTPSLSSSAPSPCLPSPDLTRRRKTADGSPPCTSMAMVSFPRRGNWYALLRYPGTG